MWLHGFMQPHEFVRLWYLRLAWVHTAAWPQWDFCTCGRMNCSRTLILLLYMVFIIIVKRSAVAGGLLAMRDGRREKVEQSFRSVDAGNYINFSVALNTSAAISGNLCEERTAYIHINCTCMAESSPLQFMWHRLPPHNSIVVSKNEVYYGCSKMSHKNPPLPTHLE